MKVFTIIGARPQIIKAAAISRAIRTKFPEQLTEVLVHTGQHYDENMSGVFIDELNIPAPDYNLNLGSGKSEDQMKQMQEGIEELLLKEQPQVVLVYGDTNSTLAGSLAASKLNIPLVHVEAGLRSFNKEMPEEINRIECDHRSTLLFSPTKVGCENLEKEGIHFDNKPPFTVENPGVYHCGDIMYDNAMFFSDRADEKSTIIKDSGIEGDFILATIHRNTNTDSSERLSAIFQGLIDLVTATGLDVVLPIHPRTKKMMDEFLSEELMNNVKEALTIIEPTSYLNIIALEKNASLVVTDSGGVQKEAFFFQTPCVILREETEWVEIVENGNAILAGADTEKIVAASRQLLAENELTYPSLYGDGKAAEFICGEILKLG